MSMFSRRRRYSLDDMGPALPLVAIAATVALGYFAYQVVRRRKSTKVAGPMTPSTIHHHAADHPIGPAGDNDDDRLDEALQESFPTSDPVSIQIG